MAKVKDEKEEKDEGTSAPALNVVAIGVSLQHDAKVKPTRETIAYCAAKGRTYVPRLTPVGSYEEVSPLGAIIMLEANEWVLYVMIPDRTGKYFTVPLETISE